VRPIALPKDLSFAWPAGMIGNATPISQCTAAQFFTTVEGRENTCPPQTVVGVISLTVYEPAAVGFATYILPIFNLEPLVGEPARFGFFAVAANAPGFINTSVRTGSDYGVTVSIDSITQTVEFLSSRVTLWGTPGDPSHARQRGWGCLLEALGEEHSPCSTSVEQHSPSLLSLPTSCSAAMQTSVEGNSWTEPGSLAPLAQYRMPGLTGCGALRFNPELEVSADEHETSKPTGLVVHLHVPQETDSNAEELATSNLRNIHLTLPTGVTLNPAAADDLQACSESQVGFTGVNPQTNTDEFTPILPEPLVPGSNFCSDKSKLGTVKIETPLLPNPLEGAIYLATQNANPFGSLIALYLVAEDPVSRTLVKLAGSVSLNQDTGQIAVSFQNTPQLPLEDIELHFLSGERALLATPARCGRYLTNASLVPWSSETPVSFNSSFEIGTGLNGSSCTYPGQALPFAPSLQAATSDYQAAAFSPFTATISREDGQQALGSFELRLPPGLSGMLAHVPLCPEVQANAGTCPSTSLIGETTVSAGLGGDPYTLSGGRIYLTGPTNSTGPCTVGTSGCAPFGLSIVTPVKAGPLDLENSPENHPACDCLVIRAKIEVDPQTAQLTIVTGAGAGGIPSIIDGVPLQIRRLNVTIDREGFIFNPTNCNKMAVTSTVTSSEGMIATPSTPFHAASCMSLIFKPKLTAVTRANGEFTGHGASLHLAIATGGGQANVHSLKLDLPQRLPARLETIQKACQEATFKQNPAICPKASVVGSATVHTPILAGVMTGPAYLVAKGGTGAAHPGESKTEKEETAFPDLVLVLQGDGVRIDLTGGLYVSKKNITSTTFRTIPDIPISRLDLILPEGKTSIFAASAGLCTKRPLQMTTAITAQNGLTVKPTVKVAVSGCKKPKRKHHAKKRQQR
jgi:hypothetical protein